MKKLLLIGATACGLLPALAFAAYNDVNLTSSASVILDNGTLNVVGDSNLIETMTVSATELHFTLDSGSKLKVSSPTFRQLSHSAPAANVSSAVCESNESSISLTSSADDVAITVALKNDACPIVRGGGGGRSGATATAIAGTPVQSATAATIASLQAQLNILLAQLTALQSTQAPGAGGAEGLITANISSGSRGPSIRALQAFLNAQGFTVAASGPGSPGNETENFGSLTVKAVQKFQEKYGIAAPGVSGYGRVGPKTRAKINELSGN